MKKSAITFAVTLMAASVPQSNAFAADPQAGRDAFETCRGCHSNPEYSSAYPTYHVPKIGGQRTDYTIAALTAYKEQSRPHGTMKANAYDLSEKNIEDIAAYLAEMKGEAAPSPAKGDPAIGKKLAEACLSCHTESKDAQSSVPRLAGQYGSYLVKAMKDYKAGKRNNAVMQSMLQELSEADLENIAAYFAGQKGLTTTE